MNYINNDRISNILASEGEGKIIALTGKWGCGKTHRWEKEIEPKIHKYGKETIYISAFGKQNADDLKLDLLDKLINSKGFVFDILMRLALTLLVWIITLPFLGKVLELIINTKTFPLTFTLSFCIAMLGLAFISNYIFKSLLKFMSLKILGIDHKNIDWNLIYTKEKPILCFDDIERLPDNKDFKKTLGFFEELKKKGFSVLLIANDEKLKGWQDFKEKVIFEQYTQPIEQTLDSILKDYEWLDNDEKQYLIEIHKSLLDAPNHLNQFIGKYHQAIKDFAHNFRFLIKVIRAIQNVRIETKEYKDIDHYTKMHLLSYIATRTLIKELQINDYDLLNNNEREVCNAEKDPKKSTYSEFYIISNFTARAIPLKDRKENYHMGKLLVTESVSFGIPYIFLEVKRLLTSGDFDYKKFIAEY